MRMIDAFRRHDRLLRRGRLRRAFLVVGVLLLLGALLGFLLALRFWPEVLAEGLSRILEPLR